MKVCLMMMTKSFLRPCAAAVDREGGTGAGLCLRTSFPLHPRRFEDLRNTMTTLMRQGRTVSCLS